MSVICRVSRRDISKARTTVCGLQPLVGRALATPWKRRASHLQKVNLELKGFFLPKKSSSPCADDVERKPVPSPARFILPSFFVSSFPFETVGVHPLCLRIMASAQNSTLLLTSSHVALYRCLYARPNTVL